MEGLSIKILEDWIKDDKAKELVVGSRKELLKLWENQEVTAEFPIRLGEEKLAIRWIIELI